MSTASDDKHAYEHHDGASAGSTNFGNRFEGAPEGWDPVSSTWDCKAEKDIIHRVDRRLLPILGLMYAVSLIDRTNMSNARIAGMQEELQLGVGERYSIALLVFFIPYFLFELPSNIILRKVGAAIWLGGITLAWGLVMMGMGFVKNWGALTALRATLGLFEAGFFPGCVYLISCWYVRYEVQKRLAAFYLVSVLAGGFSSLLAYGLMQMDGLGGYRGWSWIFIIEGLMTIVIAIAAFFLIIDFPDKLLKTKHAFLSVTEIEIIKHRIDRDRKDSEADPLTWAKTGEHLKDWKLWVFAFLFMCTTLPSYAFSYFLPVILKISFGFSTEKAQLLTAPPYVFAVTIAMILATVADKMKMRGPFIAFQAIMTTIGLLVVLYAKANGARYFGVFLGIAGCSGNVPAILAYQSNNIRTNSKRSVGSALQVGFGAIGGILASTVFREKDAPTYKYGFWATMGSQFLILVLLAISSTYFYIQNKKMREGKRSKPIEGAEGFYYTY